MERKSNDKNWKIIQRIGTVIAILAALATIIGLYLQYKEKKPSAEIKIISADLLTQQTSEISGFTSSYTYNDIEINNLWLYKISFINTGEATIITKGAKQNTINNSIKLKFENSYRVLDVMKTDEDDFNSKLIIQDSITIDFRFSQWRPKEKSTYSLLIVSDSAEQTPIPYFEERSLVDGDISIFNSINSTNNEIKPIIDKIFSKVFSRIGRILSVTLLSLLCVLAIFVLFKSSIEKIKLYSWKSSNLENFRKFIYSDELLKKADKWETYIFKSKELIESREQFIKKPWTVKEKIWEQFDGRKLKMDEPLFAKTSDYLISSIICIVSIFGCISGVLAIIIM